MITLGLDCGTQSTKCIALDLNSGAVLASAQQAYALLPDLPAGAMEQDPDDWIAAAQFTIGSVIQQLGIRKAEIRGIGVSGQQHGLVPLDVAGKVVRPAKLWCDTSTSAQCAEITRHFGGSQEVIARVGNAMLPGYTAPKILWLKQNEPENWNRTAHVLLPHDYLNFWLTGTLRMEYGDASGTALFNVRDRRWCDEMIEFIGPELKSRLPEATSSRSPHGPLADELAKTWGIADVIVSSGGGDNMMGAIGTGNIRPGVVTASLGTSGTIYAFASSPVIDPAGEVAAFCDSTDGWLPLVCTMNVTLVTELCRDLFNWSHADFDAAAGKIPAGAEGLLLLPYLAGERTPNLPNGSGFLGGLTTKNFTPAHLARATMEGVTLGLGYGLQRLRSLGIRPTEIRLTGGGSNSPLWRQICASIFGASTVCLKSGEGAALGAALQAGSAAGANLADLVDSLVEVDEATRAEPNQADAECYRELLGRSATLRATLHNAKLL